MWNFCKLAKEKFYLRFLWFSTVRIIILILSTLISFIWHRLHIVSAIYVFLQGATFPGGSGNPYYRGFTIKLRHLTLGMTPLDYWIGSSWQHTTHLTQISIPPPPEEFEPVIPASERPHNHALERSATGIDPTTDGVAKHLSVHNEIPLRLTTCSYLCGLHTMRLEKLVGNNVALTRSIREARVAKLNTHHVKQMNRLCGDE